ncbi:TniQ family protein [Nostoc sp. UHCC 0870]|uniref:TniQ family protein n=1 Tax=Nostoc sp. UHCC 0870 TaxID=2914041 RepID=UPI001EDED1D3|nr:TniQ family protein [Nostoc sp. UHCC 0870]UKO99999.1 TniQ family protein [Nostoc sp. UHCC 0870]
MKINLNLLDELLDLEKPIIPPRSRLFSLEPIGLGTPYVESLTSYVVRLAETHSITTSKLVTSEIVPILRQEDSSYTSKKNSYIFSSIGSSQARGALNGTGVMSSNLVQALTTLTLRSDLCFLTMLPWAEVIASQKALSRHIKAWCHICYNEWQEQEQVVYEPLIWTLDVIKVCPRHHQRLQTQCPHCHKQLLALEEKTRLGYCSKCQGWLGVVSRIDSDIQCLSENELSWQIWVAENIGKIIATAPHLESFPSREVIGKIIYEYVNQATKGNYADFASFIGKSRTNVSEWCSGRKIPKLITTLQICEFLGIPLLDFFRGIIHPINHPTINKQYQKQKLQKLDLAQQLGCDDGKIYRHFPDFYHIISARYLRYRQAHRQELAQKIREDVRQAALKLHAEGKNPHGKSVGKLLSKPGIMLNKEAQVALRQIRLELGYEK